MAIIGKSNNETTKNVNERKMENIWWKQIKHFIANMLKSFLLNVKENIKLQNCSGRKW